MRLTRDHDSNELADVPWFAPLSPRARKALRRHADRIDVAPGTRLQRQDARVQWVWVVADGVVEVRRDGELLGLVPGGQATGEVEVLTGHDSPVEVVAATPARVYSLPAAAYHGMFAEPSFSATVARRLAAYAESSSGASSTSTRSSSPAA